MGCHARYAHNTAHVLGTNWLGARVCSLPWIDQCLPSPLTGFGLKEGSGGEGECKTTGLMIAAGGLQLL